MEVIHTLPYFFNFPRLQMQEQIKLNGWREWKNQQEILNLKKKREYTRK